MTINLILGLFIFGATFVVAAMRSVGTAFAIIFIPALLFFRPVAGYVLNGGLPELRISNAAVVGLMAGMCFRIGQQMKIRWSITDLIILLAPAAAITSAIQTENWHTGHDELLKQLLGWLVPYFVARYSFRNENFRKNFLQVLIVCSIVLGIFAALEFRMWPHFYAEKLGSTGLKVGYNQQAVQRGNFFRAETSFEHPIFFGDGCVSMACLLLMVASTLKGGWIRPMVLIAVAAAAGGLFTSLSFGPYLGMAIAGGVFFLLRFVTITRWYILFCGTLTLIIALIMLTLHFAKTEIPTRTKDGSIYDSFLVRWEIVQKCAPLAIEAGPFGNGKPKIAETDSRGRPILELESVDNAYMLFLVVRGFIYASLWAAIPLAVAARVSKALRKTKRNEFVFPIAMGAGASIGVSFAFYFVWAGWNPEPYTILWLVATAFTMSCCDLCFEQIKADERATVPARPQGGPPVYQPPPGARYPMPNVARI